MHQDGLTPLMYAVKNGHLKIVKYLLQSGYIDMAATSKVGGVFGLCYS